MEKEEIYEVVKACWEVERCQDDLETLENRVLELCLETITGAGIDIDVSYLKVIVFTELKRLQKLDYLCGKDVKPVVLTTQEKRNVFLG
jgi:hypothetical protein